ncbi:hybrid sensor histidine kinase/response regulator [Merismopedia glauca]|uniref:histidine kinase n=1 Tax=Merismopedia glauca CCAP 1448/3 TaxID=1296344 RepID=A0A2T1BY29_9CYAN|nr:hybrid sensor histidine kinase/response regulator [Merismopedia glauca]PSB00808.1 hybrid sensor histidine kinase/response regulator [Merismopedia glauca CCAP 1448/3]
MDNEKKIPLKFLDESEDCCDRIESTVLGLANTIPNPQELDLALRAAHSVKGGAAMMGFAPLSHVAHQLEDFFKILRVRYHSKSINTEVETLLLQGVDCLRQVGNLHRRGQLVSEVWLSTQSQLIFDRLRQHLGDLRPEDEDALLSQEGDVDPAILLFESGVQEALDRLEGQLESLSATQLLEELQATADELSDFGRMARLDRFVNLCQSVKSHSQSIDRTQVVQLTRQSLQVWRRSHSLVVLGRFEKIPSELTEVALVSIAALDKLEFVGLPALEKNISGMEEFAGVDFSLLQSEITNLNLDTEGEFNPVFDEIQPPPELFSELADCEIPELSDFLRSDGDYFASLPDVTNFLIENQPPTELISELANLEIPELPSISGSNDQLNTPVVTPTVEAIAPNRQTVRVPVEYLQQFHNIFGQLILERNAIDLRLGEIQKYTGLLRKRMQHLESSNRELRQWYDRAATEGLIPTTEDRKSLSNPANPPTSPTQISSPEKFDLLEMDRYNDLHVVSQDQIETIVQLQEVTADIELSLQEMTRSVSSLNQTTRILQKNVTRTQMLPFADVVKRFPRLIRDLSVQFGKSVTLKILGEHTGIDRAILENLSDPLMHLVRNAFDHGIEDPATRLAAGKPEQGTIVLEATQRSGETIITISDDGGGIQLDRIRDRLQQIGLSAEEVSKMPESDLLEAIFEPGFSTATNVTELSGRGVGMDVFGTNIKEIRGDIRVKSQPGRGTTFKIRVPFALSILRVMLLERAGFLFAVSVDSVKEIIRFQPDLLTTDGTKISWQSQVIPVVALERGISFGRTHRPFQLPGIPTISQPTVLVVGEDQLSTAFYIDRFWGEQEVTLRAIDSPMPLTPGFGNSIILGDGRVVPLVDLMELAGWMSANSDSPANLTPPTRKIERSLDSIGERTQTDPILVIDDSINVRRYLAVMLEKEGYQVEQAKDGQEAVDKLLGGLVVQAAICDIEMPRLDGYGVLEALRSQTAFTDLPIVMLTSRNSEKHRMLAMNLGASAYFSKPYTEPELLGTLRSLIERFSTPNDPVPV